MDDAVAKKQAQTERKTRSVCYLLYVFFVGGAYVLVMLVPAIVSALLVNFSLIAPEFGWRYDPLLEIRIDHSLLVLDEPVALGTYRLNDLFSKFDKKILASMQLRWFMVTIQEFHKYLGSWLDRDSHAITEATYARLIVLADFLKETPNNPEKYAEAISRMRDWMDSNPILEQNTKQE